MMATFLLAPSKRDSLVTMNQFVNKRKNFNKSTVNFDSTSLNVINQIIQTADNNNIDIVFFRSPLFRSDAALSSNLANNFRDATQKQLIDFNELEIEKLKNAKYWKNGSHVNDLGADIQSKRMIEELKKLGYDP